MRVDAFLGSNGKIVFGGNCLETGKLAVNTVVLNICALRFLYIKLKRRDSLAAGWHPPDRRRWLRAGYFRLGIQGAGKAHQD
jgi:hypothetical protein